MSERHDTAGVVHVGESVRASNTQRKNEIPYKEGRMKDIGAHVGYTILWAKISKVVRAGVQMCYYPAAPPSHVMAVLSRTRVVRLLCMAMAAPCCAAACMCVGAAA